MTTKEQERKALEQIRAIVEGLGNDSYIGTAFEGCFEIAEENIQNDFACSMKQRAESAEATVRKSNEEVKELQGQLKAVQAELTISELKIKNMEKLLDNELEWHDCEAGTTLEQGKYEVLAGSGEKLTEDEAKEEIYQEYGFAKERVTILNDASTYEVNRHHQMRKKQTFDRPPVYESSDWNYIRFNCAGWMYEMVNGELHNYTC